jgi:fructoselysine-6-P-deglycase FrlB-like protein
LPLVAVGSGGSYTSAHLAIFLHTLFTGRVGKAITPLELLTSSVYLPDLALLLLTAGGSNPDILACLERAKTLSPGRFGTICTRKGSLLADAVASSSAISLHEYELPTGKDGFLATNSLLATGVLLARAYGQGWSGGAELPASLGDLVHPGVEAKAFRDDLERRCQPLWDRETLVVLHGHTCLPAAVDLESKFTEAALGHLQTADLRNFAHGRHHWLARHGASTAVLALVTPEDRLLAEQTLRLLPQDVAVARVDLPRGPVLGMLAALVAGMYTTGLAGQARGIDPGRPKVPPFGRRLYHLGVPKTPPLPESDLAEDEAAAIERKAGLTVATLAAQGRLSDWRKAFAAFRESLRSASFGALVLDYDGTLCGAAERYSGPGPEVAERLTALLRAGVHIGVATGRGRSVRKDLSRLLVDRALWDRVLVGYHNGGEVGPLSDETLPPSTPDVDESLRGVAAAIRAHRRLPQLAACEARLRQITLELVRETGGDEVWEMTERLVRQHAPAGTTLVRSSHSIDILAPGVSKKALVVRVREVLARDGQHASVLCIGDKGRWPGNDFALLEEPFAMSVDEVSLDPETCWSLAPAGERCVAATLFYLRLLEAASGRFTVRV